MFPESGEKQYFSEIKHFNVRTSVFSFCYSISIVARLHKICKSNALVI